MSSWGHACPADPAHGQLIPWPHSDVYGWFCPHQGHDGGRGRPQGRALFTTDEARSGVLASVPTAGSAPDLAAAGAVRSRDAGRPSDRSGEQQVLPLT